jgi:hypothetical protein
VRDVACVLRAVLLLSRACGNAIACGACSAKYTKYSNTVAPLLAISATEGYV